jgi:uracil-DNA glycosylase family 4
VPDHQNPASGLQLLRRHLDERTALGENHVWLTDRALEQVNTLPMRARAAASKNTASIAPTPSPRLKEEPATQTGGDKRTQLDAIRDRAESCQRCRSLGTLRDTMVFAVGHPDADLMFIGEAPEDEEEKQREPFVGPAGQLLTKIIRTMGLDRDSVYLSNIAKFRPATGGADQGTANRKPGAEEMAASLEYIRAEIAVVQPKLIVALGGTAMEGLLGLDGSVGRARGEIHEIDGIPTIVTYHPSYLLRSGSNSDKRKVWEDLLIAMERLDMPISEKQRGFFSG